MKFQNCKIRHIVVLAMILIMMTILLASLSVNSNSVVFQENEPKRTWNEREIIMDWELTQADGTILKVERVRGGFNNPTHFYRINGYTLQYDRNIRSWCWAYQDETGRLRATEYPAHLYDPEELGFEKDIRYSEEVTIKIIQEILEAFIESDLPGVRQRPRTIINMRNTPNRCPTNGEVQSIVIYISLDDQGPHEFPTDEYVMKFDALNEYYQAVSYSKLQITSYL
ncbi:MAG: hypothetical protein FWG98_00685 [Candidatus Cloacimonetes bacterium]|nr:hypothetical protein [Candidatus Cloacimonadota bacterium]